MHHSEGAELAAVRHERLLAVLSERSRITTNTAALELGVSVDTIRRDLRLLHERGLLQRVHGGALKSSPLSPSYNGRNSDDSTERAKLADAVLTRLHSGQVIGLDAGTTTTEVAARLPMTLDITVVTNNPAAATALADHPMAKVILVGGAVDLRWLATTGSTAVDAIRGHHLDLAIVGACSVDPAAGITTRSQHEVATKQAFIAAAVETVVPIESSKLGTVAPFRIASAQDVGVVVVEDSTDPRLIARLRSAGMDIDTI